MNGKKISQEEEGEGIIRAAAASTADTAFTQSTMAKLAETLHGDCFFLLDMHADYKLCL